MSACFPGAFPARSVGLSICGLTIVIICLTLQQPVAAKNSILFDYHKDAIATRSDGDLVALRRSEVKEEIMHNCTKITEGSHIKVVCGHETFYEAEPKDSPGSFTFFRDVVLCVFFVIMSGTYYTIQPFSRSWQRIRARYSIGLFLETLFLRPVVPNHRFSQFFGPQVPCLDSR